jgi:outer membrane protein assembly factor BamB
MMEEWKMLLRGLLICLLVSVVVHAEETHDKPVPGGLCVVIGEVDPDLVRKCTGGTWVVHALSRDRAALDDVRRNHDVVAHTGAEFQASLWTTNPLPYVDNLANLIFCDLALDISDEELLRVLRPGGRAHVGTGAEAQLLMKPPSDGTDEWPHPWHRPSGGLVTDDETLGIPTGIQWVQGPLFAMAGRKTSTQSVVIAGGRMFAVTQNVVENIGREEMPYYLVARDAYNGILLWKQPWQGPFTLVNGALNPRIAATDDRVYVGWFDGIHVFDAATGELIERITMTDPVSKLLVQDGYVITQNADGLRCYEDDGEQAELCWEFVESGVDGVVAEGDSIYALLKKRTEDGERVGELICLALADGGAEWQVETEPWDVANRVRIGFVNDGWLALIAHGSLHLMRAATGELLWTKASNARPGKDYSDERYVGHFYRHGLVWMQLENSPREPDGQATWAAYDPATGDERQRLETSGPWPRTAAPAKMGCQLMVASDRHIMIPRQATFVDFATGEKHSFKFIRGGCGSGFVPANGMVYSSPHACGCYTEVVRGFLAAHSRSVPDASLLSQNDRLLQALEAPVTLSESEQISPEDWPMHRRDPARTSASQTILPETLSRRWSAKVARSLTEREDAAWQIRSGMPITAPVVAAGTVYVCNLEEHQVVAVDDSTGKVRWTFTADGRIDSPPTIWEGRCLFGCHDGYVYCVRARDGRLLWRYLAAPVDQRIVAFGQVESAWPVAGSVLVQDGITFAAAGRAPDADGGITVVALDARTGELRWCTKADSEMTGMCDYLVGGADAIFLADRRFNAGTGQCGPSGEASPHLRGGKAGLLETSWFDANLALRKSIHTWTACGETGQLLAFGKGRVFGYVLSEEGEGKLFCKGVSEWSNEVPEPRQVRALVAANDHVVSSGANARYDRSKGGFLAVNEPNDGRPVLEMDLPAAPVFDGLAVARGRVYVSLADGTVLSMGLSE